jgi:hypothetical protein
MATDHFLRGEAAIFCCHSTFMVNCMVGLFLSLSANHQVKVDVNPGPQLLSGL